MNNHRVLHPFCQITYWKGHTASDPSEQWTHCRVSPLGMFTVGEMEFPNTDAGKYAAHCLVGLLELTYEQGKRDAMKALREFIGVQDPRR